MSLRLSGALSALLFTMVSVSENAFSEVITDPDGTGATGVFLTPSQMVLGLSNAPGTLEINANSSGNGFTTVNVSSIAFVGASSSLGLNSGTLRVIGDGGAASASVFAGGSGLVVGVGGNGLVEIRNGGLISASSIQLGSAADDADIIVDGVNSRLEATSGDLDFSGGVEGPTRSLTISNGATMGVSGAEFGSRIFSNYADTIAVTGAGSIATFEVQIDSRGTLNVLDGGLIQQIEVPGLLDNAFDGFKGFATGATEQTSVVNVSGMDANGNASRISLTRDAQIGGRNLITDAFVDANGDFQFIEEPTSGTLTVENGGIFETTGTVLISENGTGGTGVLTVRNGGEVIATSVTIAEGGTLNGSGGIITADLIVDGGTVAPGNSPGEIVIDGNLDFISGLLEIEIAGTGDGEFDVLKVLGDVVFSPDSTIALSFTDGFAPSTDDVFNFLQADTFSSDMSLINFIVLGLEPGFEFDVDFTGTGTFGMTALNNGVSAVPVPAAIWLFGSGLLGIIGVSRRKKAA